MVDPTVTVAIRLSEYRTWGQTVHRLETRLHKARVSKEIAQKQLAVAMRAMDDRKLLRHQMAAVQAQVARLLKSLEKLIEENKELKDELAFYRAKEQM